MITDTVDDIIRKFKDTFVFLEWNGKKILVQVIKVTDDGDFRFNSPQYGEILLSEEDVRQRLSHKFPESGLYNVFGVAVDFNRLPERQWKRAPCNENCSIRSILKTNFNLLDTRNETIDLHTLETLLEKYYPNSIDNAIDSCASSIALNKNFAISHTTGRTKNPFLFWYRSTPIGSLDPKTREIEINYKPLYQEAVDYIKKQETSWTLKLNPL